MKVKRYVMKHFVSRLVRLIYFKKSRKYVIYFLFEILGCVRWIQNPLDTPGSACLPQPAGFFFLGAFADEKKSSGSASIDASRLIFQSAVSFSNPLGSLSNPLGCDNIFETSPDTICQCESHIYQHRS